MMTEDLKRNPNIWIHQDGLQEDLNRSHNVTEFAVDFSMEVD